MEKGFIKLFRKLKDWEWYKEETTFHLFIHLLLSVNWEDKKWLGIEIKRGQILTTQRHLARDLFDDENKRQKIRTALANLESTQEITIQKTPKGSIITVNNYDEYQMLTQDLTQNSPTANPRLTHTKEYKELKEDKEEYIEIGGVTYKANDPNRPLTYEERKEYGLL